MVGFFAGEFVEFFFFKEYSLIGGFMETANMRVLWIQRAHCM